MKKLWRDNKILVILGGILVLCFIAILVIVLTYFVGTRKSVYGDRFTNMKTHIKDKEQDAYVKALEENPNVQKVRFRVSNKTLYISVTFKADVPLDDAKKITEDSLALFSDKIKETYDINFTINIGDLTLMGARNSSGNGLFWNNNTPVTQSN
ncbi:MAG: hypothetical protein K6G37_03335 [Bacilli bacterium]|nr:hypothetical protein [Bacilli bacterium]